MSRIVPTTPQCMRSRAMTAPIIASTVLLACLASPIQAGPPSDIQLVIKNQMFKPATLSIPAEQTVKIMVKNEDALPAEFESSNINREKVIPGGTQVPIYIGPLKAGTYYFFNDFHPESKGTLIVVPAKQ